MQQLKIRVLVGEQGIDLELKINEWLNENPHILVCNIQYQVAAFSVRDVIHSALIQYHQTVEEDLRNE